MLLFVILATCLLAYSNGANDNAKGVATLFGSHTTSYRVAIGWGTVTTAAGSLTAVLAAHALVQRFSGKGLVSPSLVAQPEFLLAVALAAGLTVILASVLGFPISTTHSLTGGLVGAGLCAGVSHVDLSALGANFLRPLLLSPVIALAAGALLYVLVRRAGRVCGIPADLCVCASAEPEVNMSVGGEGAATALPRVTVTADRTSVCRENDNGGIFALTTSQVLDALHFLSAGAVGFARGLNDTPKIAALLLAAGMLEPRWGITTVTIIMAIGGLLNARKVAETMAHKITTLTPLQGLTANLATAVLVNTASFHGLPVSTTHVSVGSLLGIGLVSGQAKWKPVLGIVLSWVITLPCAAALAALIYTLL